MTIKTFPVPAMFYDDHDNSDLPMPEEVKRAGSRVYIRADDPNIGSLLSDAEFYADPNGPDELPPGLKASAKRTVQAITIGLAWAARSSA